MPAVFQLFLSGVVAVIKGVFIFFNVVNNYRYIKVFKFLAYLGARAYTVVLFKGLYTYNLSLLKRLFYFKAMAFYKMSIEFLFKLL